MESLESVEITEEPVGTAEDSIGIIEEPIEIKEESLISPDFSLYKTKITDNKGNILGYALECDEGELDICIFLAVYKGMTKLYIDKKIEEILSKSKCATQRVVLINERLGIEKIPTNYTSWKYR